MKRPDVAASQSLRARINNYAKTNGISPQLALQGYFSERFLARIEQSPYVHNLAVKGGTLMSALLGVGQRTTMDIDATVIGMHADEIVISRIIKEVASLDIGDGITFEVDASRPAAIRKDDDYGGYSVGMFASLGTIRLPIGIDVTFGDVITPSARKRKFTAMLDPGTQITVFAYTVETILAEKLQTVLKRGEANTRPRDFYDLYRLEGMGEFDHDLLRQAMENTLRNRHSEKLLDSWRATVNALKCSQFQRDQWRRYCAKASYAIGIDFDAVLNSISRLFEVSA